MSYIGEAFKSLNFLNENDFSLNSVADIDDMSNFLKSDVDMLDTQKVIDPDANTEEELKDSYVGKVILSCPVCHSLVYKDVDDIHKDEEDELVNIGDECPFCYTTDGFRIVGQVTPFIDDSEDAGMPDMEDEDNKEEVDESLNLNEAIGLQGQYVSDDTVDEWEETIRDTLDTEVFLGALLNQMSIDERCQAFEYIARVYEIDLGDEEEEDEDMDESFNEDIEDSRFVKQNDNWIPIETIEDEHDESKDFEPSFWFENNRHYLSDFTRVHNNPYMGGDFPEFIHGVESEEYYDPLFIELDDSGDNVNVYREVTIQDESLNEDLEYVEIETDNETVTMDSNDEGGVVITTTPKKDEEEECEDCEPEVALADGETISPITSEVKDSVKNSDKDEEVIEFDIDDFDEESFNNLGESYLKRVYTNVNSFATTGVSVNENRLVVEGLIKFNSGKEKKTNFVFESKVATDKGKVKFIGENTQITRGKKAFTITGSINNKKFITEKLNYNYMTKNSEGNSVKLYGTIK